MQVHGSRVRRLRSSARCLLATSSFVALGLASTSTRAQGSDDEAIEVTVRGSSAGSFNTTVSPETSPREAVSAATLVSEVPGVAVRRLGADGSFATLSVRGSASTQVGVMLGRIPLTSGADPSFDLGSMPLWTGGALRVYRGFAPASAGSTGYLGGVLVIEPPSLERGARTEWWTLAGSLGTLKLRAGDLRRIGDVTTASAIFASRADGDFTYPIEDPRSGAIVNRTRQNGAVKSAGGIERISLSRPWGNVSGTLLVDARSQGLPGSIDRPTRFAELSTARFVGGVEAVVHTGARGGIHAGIWGRRESSNLHDPLGELDPTAPKDAVQVIDAAGGSIGWRGRLVDPMTIDLFVDGRGERFAPGAPAIGSPDRASRITAGLGAEIEWRATRAITVAGSGRIDARRDDATGTPGIGQAAFGASSDLVPSGHAGVSARISDAAVLTAHAGALERPPGFVELYGSRGELVGDPSLRPERAISIDAGIQGDFGDRFARFGYEVVGFATEARDLIAFLPVGIGTLHARNIDRARLLGGEVSAQLRARHVATRLSYTLLHTENEAPSGVESGRPLPGRPMHDVVYDATYVAGPLSVRYGLDVVTGTTIDTSGALVLPPRVLHGLGASILVPAGAARSVRAGVQIDNLFDQRAMYVAADSALSPRPALTPVSDFLGFPIPGRTLWATVRFESR